MSTPPRYRLLSSLGRGGMGEVWLADDAQLGRKVAIKFVTEALEADPTARERLHREARSAAALDHPYICKIHEISDVDGRTGIVMEHVSGETLQATLVRGPIRPRRALEIAGEVAEALEAAHARGLVHRDFKPANVMLADGHVKVMDFGLAKALTANPAPGADDATQASITGSGVRLGTRGYMAPEQLLGADTDTRSDIFAFGIVLYEMLAGLHPYRGTSQNATVASILRDTPTPVTQHQDVLPTSATTMLDRLLEKEPDQRHQSFADVRTDLKRLLDEVSGAAPIPAAGLLPTGTGPIRPAHDEPPTSDARPNERRFVASSNRRSLDAAPTCSWAASPASARPGSPKS
jgi:prepilin-type processing-associated H-X9-DG protein